MSGTPAAAGRAADPGADLVDHGRDPVLRDLVRHMTTRWRCARSPTRSFAGGCSPLPASRRSRRSAAPSGSSRSSPIPDQLRANNVSVNELLDAVRGASQNTSAGIYMEGPQEYVLQTIGRVRTPEEIGESVVALRGDRSVLIRDVADVREGAALKRGEGSRNGKPAVIVGVQKQPGANTIELTARLDRELDALQQELPAGMTIDRRIFRQSDFIEVAVDNVITALRDGGLLVVVIVVLFLANLRAAAITLTAMPLSLAAAVLVLRAFGATINTMTLGGMAIAIGALVDDAIIDVENVVRRLRENAARPPEEQRPAADGGPRRHARNPHVDRVRDDHHRAGVPADLRAVRRRRPAAGAARGCLHRGADRVAGVAIVVTPALAIAFLPGARSILSGHDGWLARDAQGTFCQGPAARARPSRGWSMALSAAAAGRSRSPPSRAWARRSCRSSTKAR